MNNPNTDMAATIIAVLQDDLAVAHAEVARLQAENTTLRAALDSREIDYGPFKTYAELALAYAAVVAERDALDSALQKCNELASEATGWDIEGADLYLMIDNLAARVERLAEERDQARAQAIEECVARVGELTFGKLPGEAIQLVQQALRALLSSAERQKETKEL